MRNQLDSQSSNQAGIGCRMLRNGLLLSCLMAIFALLCVVPAMAQLSGKGQITGTVTDKTGAVIPNAELTAINMGTGIKTVTKTTGAGDYHFSALDPGIYTVSAVATGFSKLTQQNVHVNAMESQVYNPVLSVAGATPIEITVTAEPPQLETSNATLGSTMEQETYSELPVMMGAYGQPDQRRATDFVYLMPGVQGNNTNGNATTNVGVVNGSGSKGAASAVYIDGIPFVRAGGNGDPRYVWSAISVDAIDQFQVQTNGYSAIYEGQGVMNYTVKQGKAQQHGSIYEFFRNTALDTWGFWKSKDPVTKNYVKPVEHNNEYGINLGGPLVPFGKMKDKLFYFTNYNGYRYSSANPMAVTFPTTYERQGDFSASSIKIYDPASIHTTVNGNNQTVWTRDQFKYNGVYNTIDPARFSTIAKNMQAMLPTTGMDNTILSSNYVAANSTGLNNWTTTSRVDYVISPKDTFSIIGAVGRQASSVPVAQTTATRNVGPVPYNYGQAYAPKTAVWTLEETHTFTDNLINQLKWGYARYNGPSFTPNNVPQYAAKTMGIGNTPVGQATTAFPIVTFGTANIAPTQWGGTTANSVIAENYTLLDNVQWNRGRHSFTFGGQIAWLLYNTASATGGSTPITLANATTETAQFSSKNTNLTNYTTDSTTGIAYASFLLGQIDSVKYTDYNYHIEYGARFRAISPYFQDDWKVNSKLTLNLGLRYDFFPTVREVNNMASYFDPNVANTTTGFNGGIAYTGHGTNTCNCNTPANNYYKNWGPRIGLAYQVDPKTVVRASYGVMFTHGDAVGGLAYSMGTLGFSGAYSSSTLNAQTVQTSFLAGGSGQLDNTYATVAAGAASGSGLGSGYVPGNAATPQSMTYLDPYYGSRAPEYINWSLGIQRQLTSTIALTASYVGSEGHFLQLDNYSARGKWANLLDPKYLFLKSALGDKGASVASDCSNAAYGLDCTYLSKFNTTTGSLSQLLKPFPFHSISDSFGYVGNANYHALQTVVNMRNWHGLTATANYTWSRAIDDGGYFRSGYAIPGNTIYQSTRTDFISNTRMERTVSTSSQPHHFVATVVYKWPFGKTILASNRIERALLGGYTLSGVYQIYSGSPLVISSSACATNPANPSSSFCPPSYNSSFTGKARINGRWGKGVTQETAALKPFIDQNAFVATPDYSISNLSRTAPYNINGPGNYQLDASLSRSFPLHLTQASKFEFRAQWYNITNHTLFGVASTAWTSATSTFGTVTSSGSANRKAAQFTARISF